MGADSANYDLYTKLYDENMNEVYKTALFFSENQHTAEDIAQEVFYRLCLNMGNINVAAVSSWLITTARRMALNYKRDNGREILTQNVYEDIYEDLYIDSPEDQLFEKLYREECHDLLEKVLDDIYCYNERWYYAVTICYSLEKPQKEVAESMGITLKALHSMLRRIKLWLKKNYKEEYERLKSL